MIHIRLKVKLFVFDWAKLYGRLCLKVSQSCGFSHGIYTLTVPTSSHSFNMVGKQYYVQNVTHALFICVSRVIIRYPASYSSFSFSKLFKKIARKEIWKFVQAERHYVREVVRFIAIESTYKYTVNTGIYYV